MGIIELLAWVGSIIAGPLSIGLILASIITLLKVMLSRPHRFALDFLLPVSTIWLLETLLLIAAILQRSSSQQYLWLFGPSLPVTILLTMIALGIVIITGIIIQRRAA